MPRSSPKPASPSELNELSIKSRSTVAANSLRTGPLYPVEFLIVRPLLESTVLEATFHRLSGAPVAGVAAIEPVPV